MLSIPLRKWDFATPSSAWICSEGEWLGEKQAAGVNLKTWPHSKIRWAGAWGAEYHPIHLGIIQVPRCGQVKCIIQQCRNKKKTGKLSFQKITWVVIIEFIYVIPKNSYPLQSLWLQWFRSGIARVEGHIHIPCCWIGVKSKQYDLKMGSISKTLPAKNLHSKTHIIWTVPLSGKKKSFFLKKPNQTTHYQPNATN